MNTLEDCRNHIDRIDNDIIKLLEERLKFSSKIGEFKKKNGLGIVDLKREKILLDNILKKSSNLNMDKKFIKNIYSLIIENSRRNQK